jgi:glyoxylase-like metal-dependent hydrolase (beta-lactamase superfamily II)
MAGADLRRLYRRWMLELWNGDLSVAAEIVTDDFVVHQARADGARSEELRGPGAVVRARDRPGDRLSLVHSPGHTPGSQSLLVASGDDAVLLWGDVANRPAPGRPARGGPTAEDGRHWLVAP